jgi:hypothetical protein
MCVGLNHLNLPIDSSSSRCWYAISWHERGRKDDHMVLCSCCRPCELVCMKFNIFYSANLNRASIFFERVVLFGKIICVKGLSAKACLISLTFSLLPVLHQYCAATNSQPPPSHATFTNNEFSREYLGA